MGSLWGQGLGEFLCQDLDVAAICETFSDLRTGKTTVGFPKTGFYLPRTVQYKW
jgi:hypothetical protein